MDNSGYKYIGIKLSGLNHWLWFDVKEVEEDSTKFIGRAGWGLNGATTEIDVYQKEIVGRMKSSQLQYR